MNIQYSSRFNIDIKYKKATCNLSSYRNFLHSYISGIKGDKRDDMMCFRIFLKFFITR